MLNIKLHKSLFFAPQDTKNGRAALISVVSTINNDAAIAGRQSRRFVGRPGVNALRVSSHLQVTEEQFNMIQEISKVSMGLVDPKETKIKRMFLISQFLLLHQRRL